MVAEIISVGTEILTGSIVNTNSAYISEQLATLGINCYYQIAVDNNESRLEECLRTAMGRSDIVVMCGGLGPTSDDITKEVAAKVTGRELVIDAKAQELLERFALEKGLEIPKNGFKQALVPQGSYVMYNPNGTAIGMIIVSEDKSLILLPGPPTELVPMFADQVKPYLAADSGQAFYSTMVKICGLSESAVAESIKDIENSDDLTIATYIRTGEVHVRVTSVAEDEKAAKKLAKPVVKELKARFGSKIYSTHEDTTLEQTVVELLEKNQLTIATAESCTGGMLAGKIINVPGASDIFKEGFVTYYNKAKRERLGVKKSTLNKYGAVSEECAKEMVKGLLASTKADVGVSITGIAGPGGGTDDKPVGTVYIGRIVCGKVQVIKCLFDGNREKVRESSCVAALNFVRMGILEYFSEQLLK